MRSPTARLTGLKAHKDLGRLPSAPEPSEYISPSFRLVGNGSECRVRAANGHARWSWLSRVRWLIVRRRTVRPESETWNSQGCTRSETELQDISVVWSGGQDDAHRAQNTRLPASSGRTASGIVYLGWICRRSSSGSVVVVQQSAETFPSSHFPALMDDFPIRVDQLVIEAYEPP